MTVEQLEELMRWYEQNEDLKLQQEGLGALQVLAPSLARRVIAAEKLVNAGNVMSAALKGNYIVPGSAKAWDTALTAYRKAGE